MCRISLAIAFCLVLVMASLFTFLLPGGPALAADWGQAADDGIAGGFKQVDYSISSKAVFGGNLYVGTGNQSGCEVWRYDGSSWTQVVGQDPAGTPKTGPGFGKAANYMASSMAIYNNQLYVGTYNANGCEVWRTPDGTNWNRVDGGSLVPGNLGVASMAVFGSNLYVGTITSAALEVWRYNGTAWTRVVGAGGTIAAGFNNPNNITPTSMAVYGANLYVGTCNSVNGSQVWYSPNGNNWFISIGTINGFGNPANVGVNCMKVYGGSLWAGTQNGAGCEVWSFNGANWLPWAAAGIGNPNNYSADSMAVFGGNLHIGTSNVNGCEVWSTPGGAVWNQVDGNSLKPYSTSASSMAVYAGKLYVGTSSQYTGGEVWASAGAGGIPYTDWTKTNVNGFTLNDNYNAPSMAPFGGNLYVGTSALSGCEIWRFDGSCWEKASKDGFGNIANQSVACMAEFKGHLYVGTLNWLSRGQIWRSANGTDWTRVDGGLLGTQNNAVISMAVFQNRLHIGTYNITSGCQIWRTSNGTSWNRVDDGTLGSDNKQAASMAVYKGRLYMGTSESSGAGCAVFATGGSGGIPYTDWVQVNAGGFGDLNNIVAQSMAVHDGQFYVGTSNNAGCQVWSTAADAPKPADWSQAGSTAFGDTNNHVVYEMRSWDGLLYAGTRNATTGCEVWAWDGSSWAQENADGFGDIDNEIVYSMAEYFDVLFMGTYNTLEGCQVWNTCSNWYLAEGATDGGFETWVLVQNPGVSPVNVDFTLNTDVGENKPWELQGVEIPAGSRRSFNMGNWADTYNLSTRVQATDGLVICERAMYWTPAGQADRVLGHDSIGVTSPAPTWYMAEGATDGGFETWVLVQNPGTSPVHVDFTLNTGSGEQKPADLQGVEVPAGSRLSFNLANWVIDYDVSTKVVATDGEVICERAMYWSPAGQVSRVLGHDSIGVTSSAPTWYMAEGATMGGFETWVLVQNPGANPVHVDFTLNTDTGEVKPPDLQGLEIPAGSRRSFNMGNWATTFNVSTRVDCTDGNVICERAMYWTPEGQPWRELGHDSVGVTAPSAVWYMAEGATMGGFETWVLVQNPGANEVHVDFTLNTDEGEVKPADLQDMTIPAGGRVSFDMGLYEQTFNLSTKVSARDGLIICERAMYWTPEGQPWRVLGHDSVGYSP